MSIYSVLFWAILAVTPVHDEIVLVAVGDVMLARGVGGKIRRFGPEYPFSGVADLLELGDVGFCNLECVLSGEARPKSKGFVFKADPTFAHTLRQVGFDLVSVANNHTLDCGIDGLEETIRMLAGTGISPILGEPTIKEIHGVKIGLLGFNLVDGCKSSGSMICAVEELDKASDIVILSLHWGIEYVLSPSTEQLKLAHQLVDAGVDLILGHHPHRIQGIGSYRHGVIAYSLGNFVFDQRDPLGKESVMLLIELTRKSVKRVTIIPAVIVGFRPEKASNKLGERILARLIDKSAELNTHIIKVNQKGMVLGKIYPFQDQIRGASAANALGRNHVRGISKNPADLRTCGPANSWKRSDASCD